MPVITSSSLGSRARSGAAEPAARPLRVLMGVPAPGATGGGPALHLPMLVSDLRQAAVVVTTMPYGRWGEGEALPLKMWHQMVDVLRYPARVRAAAPDLVHLNTALDKKALLRDVVFVLLTRALRRRVFLKWHGAQLGLLEGGPGLWRALARFVVRSLDGLGVLNTEERAAVERLGAAPRCFVVKNAIDPTRYTERTDLHRELGIQSGAPLLLFISRLIPSKGLEDVVRGLPDVATRCGAHLLVIGDGPARPAAERLAASLGVEPAVHFLGAMSESQALRFYNGADIFVFPSFHSEGFPMALFQSVAAGLGIVTTPLAAARDHLRDPDNCLFVEPHAPRAVAAALVRLLDDRALLERMRENNRRSSARFERRAVAAEFERIYREITPDTRRPSPALSH